MSLLPSESVRGHEEAQRDSCSSGHWRRHGGQGETLIPLPLGKTIRSVRLCDRCVCVSSLKAQREASFRSRPRCCAAIRLRLWSSSRTKNAKTSASPRLSRYTQTECSCLPFFYLANIICMLMHSFLVTGKRKSTHQILKLKPGTQYISINIQ